ncbi:phosphate ABC transporter ATP-binding protein [Brachyspira catarrhinii]|uniref:Phosphate ABC transporter ATP-binding protein n=1 Tax=Brachyspira catarrhinii TaxID=2528966 RepID=A0ABY2TT17_9SPIR|nr:phosphate ABC transporter ATP-binding protein [Brachyspira catarrhinii]TKZ34832.1 phosphate ABC transporter ATP-binding protein [Brachyspira catarrhinii]
MNNILKLININVFYDDKKILDNINIEFERNKITSIIGPSGCGKTTLLKTINKIILEENNSRIIGNIEFDGVDTDNIPIEILRKNIGMVFQNPTPFPLSIYKNISYALKYYGYNKKYLENKVIDILKTVNLYDEIKDKLNTSALKLSGGQKQRLCLARSLSVEPNILLLDEPCSSLDIINSEKIEETLIKLKDKYTIIIVTHNISQAKKISDNTIFMYNGKIIERGKTEDIFSNPKNQVTKNYISN